MLLLCQAHWPISEDRGFENGSETLFRPLMDPEIESYTEAEKIWTCLWNGK
jgi:hypothetical protein